MPTARDYLSDPSLGLVREIRPSQVQMALSIEEVLDQGGVYYGEGPVGLGKTLTYLLTSVLRPGRRIIIATAKKQLQDQIAHKDLPAIANALGPDTLRPLLLDANGNTMRLCTVLKGKSNYTCQLLAAKHNPGTTYHTFLSQSRYGDRAEYPGATPGWWNHATAEDCVGRACPQSSSCGFLRLKAEATQSRVVVVNHHLLGSDVYFGRGKMTGGEFDTLIVDEAHKLADGVRAAFTVHIASYALVDLANNLARTAWVFPRIQHALQPWQELFDALPNTGWREPHLREIPVFGYEAEEALDCLKGIEDEQLTLLRRYGLKDHPAESTFWEVLSSLEVPDSVRGDLALVGRACCATNNLTRGVHTVQGHIKPRDDEEPEDFQARKRRILENTVAYGHGDRKGFVVSSAPVQLGGLMHDYIGGLKTVVLTSATLAVGQSFDHIQEVVGVAPTKAEILPPSFNYAKQGFLYVPRDLPCPGRNDPGYAAAVQRRIDRALTLVDLARGGAFILTTANDELDEFAKRFKLALPGRVFVQGHAKNPWDGDPPTVLQQYLQTPNAVLIGSKSFWEGVDVVGERLRLVIIAKLPFPIYGDPIVKAREKAAGSESFRRVQLVDMLTDLRQGAGRLIRSKLDRGVVAILDSRVWEKSRAYGRQVRSVLQFPVHESLAECAWYLPQLERYFQKLAQRGPQ